MADTEIVSRGETTTGGYLSQEFIDRAEGDWQPRNGKQAWIVCGDERGIDPASADALEQKAPEALSPTEGGLAVFGQVPGLAKNIMAVGIATHGEEFFDKVGGLDGLTGLLTRSMEQDEGPYAVVPALHSDAAKEKVAFGALSTDEKADDTEISPAAFCAHGDAATGCAYCGNLGLASALVGSDAKTQELARADVLYACGDDKGVDALMGAHKAIAEQVGADYRFTREAYAKSEMPVIILKGTPHAPAAETGVIINMNADQVGKAGEYYRMDVAAAALTMRRALPEYNLPSELLIKSLVMDAVPVRTVLASNDISGDHTAEPRRLAIGVRGGTMASALKQIEQLEHAA